MDCFREVLLKEDSDSGAIGGVVRPIGPNLSGSIPLDIWVSPDPDSVGFGEGNEVPALQ